MYFEVTPLNEWNLQKAFDLYFSDANMDLRLAKDRICKDLTDLSRSPIVLKIVQGKAAKIVANWKKRSHDFKRFAEEYTKKHEATAPTQNPTEHKEESNVINHYHGERNMIANNSVQNNYLNDAESSTTNKRKRDLTPIDRADMFFNEKEDDDEAEEADPLFILIDKNLNEHCTSIGDWNVENIAVSKNFYNFREGSVRKAKSIGFFLESQMEHILSLSSILVLKPDQYHPDLLEHFKKEELDTICRQLKSNLVPNYKEIDISDELVLSTKKVIKQLNENTLNRKQAVDELYKKKATANDMEDKIIDILINCINGLPAITIHDPLGEIDLCCNYLQPVLQPILTDFSRSIMLRWPNLKSSETKDSDTNVNKKRRPDAIASIIDQHEFGASRGFGEAKTEERRNDIGDLVRDLIRIGIFAKEAIDSNGIKSIICFQAVGNSIKFYVVALATKKLYTMFEFGNIIAPKSLEDLPSFISQSDKLMQIMSCTKNIYPTEN